jgi:hypothetical protein
MADEEPTPPADVPAAIVEAVDELSSEHLDSLAEYASDLAEHRKRTADSADGGEPADEADDLPEDVPSNATVTVKEINDNRYYYWQWREGDRIKSKYKGPVNPEE